MFPFHHVSILSKSYAQTREFYENILGLRLVKHTVNQANHKMPHLFFGDDIGTAGTLLTFFVMPRIGHRNDGGRFFSETTLGIPSGSFDYWENRLQAANFNFKTTNQKIILNDFGDFQLILKEMPADVTAKPNPFSDVPPDKQIIGLTDISLVTRKSAETKNFFQTFLNLPVTDNTLIIGENQQIHFVQGPEEITRFGNGTMDHLALNADTPEKLQQLYEKAQAQNWHIEEYVDRGYFKSLYIREPGGLRIEFATAGPGFIIDEPYETLGESLALPPFLANQRTEIENNLEEE